MLFVEKWFFCCIFAVSETSNGELFKTNRKTAAEGCKSPVFPIHHIGVSDGDRRFFHLQKPFTMSETKENAVMHGETCDKASQIIETLTSFGPISSHRLNLSEMVIAWMRSGALDADSSQQDDQQDVYFTFYLLNEVLKDVEWMQKGGQQ